MRNNEEKIRKANEIGWKIYNEMTDRYALIVNEDVEFESEYDKAYDLQRVDVTVRFKGIRRLRFGMFHGPGGSSAFPEVMDKSGSFSGYGSIDSVIEVLKNEKFPKEIKISKIVERKLRSSSL